RFHEIADQASYRKNNSDDNGEEQRELLKKREVNDDRVQDRDCDSAAQSFDRFLRTDGRRQKVFSEPLADVVRAGVSEPYDEHEKENQLRTDSRWTCEVIAEADQRSA